MGSEEAPSAVQNSDAPTKDTTRGRSPSDAVTHPRRSSRFCQRNQSLGGRRSGRSHAPSSWSHQCQTAASGQQQGHDAPSRSGSTLSRSRSRAPSASSEDRDGQQHVGPSFAFSGQEEFSGGGQRLRHDSLILDPANPGDWVISHHSSGLIIELSAPKMNFLKSTLSPIWKKIREIKEGRRTDDPHASSTSTPSSPSASDGRRFRINFAEVQRMRIRKLQCQLVRHVANIRLEGRESAGWEETLEKYIKALQDHDYMEKRSLSERDPFLATGEYAVDNYILNRNINKILADDVTLLGPSLAKWEYAEDGAKNGHKPICGTRGSNIQRNWRRGFKERVALAALGGALLVGPMWLMVLNHGLYIPLITTTAFVTAFGLLMAYFLSDGKDVLASTAAYAAVLVVFVGTYSPPSG